MTQAYLSCKDLAERNFRSDDGIVIILAVQIGLLRIPKMCSDVVGLRASLDVDYLSHILKVIKKRFEGASIDVLLPVRAARKREVLGCSLLLIQVRVR